MRPAQAEDAHLDLPPKVLQLLRLRLLPAVRIQQRRLDRLLRPRPLPARRRPRLVQLYRVGVLLHVLLEQRDDALLPPRQLLLLLRLERLAACLPCSGCRQPRVRHQRLLQPGREAGVEEAALVCLALVLPLAPVGDGGWWCVKVVVAHLLRHAGDRLDGGVPEHAHERVDAAEV
eukprot:1571615-Prymnesium_polylepis.1